MVEAHRQSAVVQAEAGDAEAALEHALAALRGSPAPSRELDLLLSESAIRALAAEPAWEEVRTLGLWSPAPAGSAWSCLEAP